MWLQRSDDLLATAWGSMDRYHLAWLMVGKPKAIVRGRPMTADEEAAYVREVADQKTAALRMSLDAVERQGMPFVGETGGPGLGEGGPVAGSRAGARRRSRAGQGGPADGSGSRRATRGGSPPGRCPRRSRRAAGPTAGPDAAMTLAMGGTRTVPTPDPIARDYLLLGLRLDQHIPGLVDGYFGPADLKALVDMEQLRSPAALRDDAAALRARLTSRSPNPDRRDWLDKQLIALETQAAGLAGEALPYLEYVTRCFASSRPVGTIASSRPPPPRSRPCCPATASSRTGWRRGTSSSSSRSIGCRRSWTGSSLGTGRGRRRSSACPRARTCGSHSSRTSRGPATTGSTAVVGRASTSTRTCPSAPRTSSTSSRTRRTRATTSSTPGRKPTWWTPGRMEASILLINTPECLISEGLADVGAGFAAPEAELVDLLVELYGAAGLEIGRDRAAAREAAERSVALMAPRRVLIAIRGNAALLRHADGRSHEEVLDYLVDVGRYTRSVSEKRLEFIEHPLWRTYVFVYAEGEALLRRWLDEVPAADRPERFARLLHEQLTPGAILGELSPSAAV